MVYKRLFLGLLTILVALTSVAFPSLNLGAQTTDPPLILWVPTLRFNEYYAVGELWLLNIDTQDLRQVAAWVEQDTTRLSPDGMHIAFRVLDQLAIDEITQQQPQNYDWLIFPKNIVVLDLSTNQTNIVADQPAGAKFRIRFPDVKASQYIARSAPTWSPDGAALAWTEAFFDHPSGLPINPSREAKKLVIYQWQSRQSSTILTDFTPQRDQDTLEVQWGKSGIAIRSQDYNPEALGSGAFIGRILLYSATGQLISSATLGDLNTADYFWVEDNQCDFIAALTDRPFGIQLQPEPWVIIQPKSGEVSLMNGVPELYSSTARSGWNLFPVSKSSSVEWIAEFPGKPILALGRLPTRVGSNLPKGIAISPDGQKFVYLNPQNQVVLDSKAGVRRLQLPKPVGDILWGPTAWRIRRDSSVGDSTDCR